MTNYMTYVVRTTHTTTTRIQFITMITAFNFGPGGPTLWQWGTFYMTPFPRGKTTASELELASRDTDKAPTD